MTSTVKRRLHIVPILFGLLLILLYPRYVFADENDTPSGAFVATLGTKYSAYINPSGDEDWFKFYVSGPGEIHVSFEVPAGLDYDIALHNSSAPSGF